MNNIDTAKLLTLLDGRLESWASEREAIAAGEYLPDSRMIPVATAIYNDHIRELQRAIIAATRTNENGLDTDQSNQTADTTATKQHSQKH